MGKTPGKWIKTLLLGKKSPKSNLVVSVKDEFSNLSLDPPVAASSQPDTASTAQNVVAPSNDDDLESRNDLDELKLEQAASRVQAVFRARQARRAFRTLKGIIRLQAVIRGHLVRRQAVATYSCIWGIVKFQALVRGRKTRSSSDNGIQCQKTYTEVGDSEAWQLSKYSWMDNPSKFIIVDKLLASSPTALPLKIQYGPKEPNSAKVWLERWTQFHEWSPRSRAARILVPKYKTRKRNYQAVVESEKARPKRGTKKQSGPTSGNGSNRSTTESEKPKRSVRKASTLSKDPLRTEGDKAKHNSRKSRSASKEGSPLEVKNEKPTLGLKRYSLSNASKNVTRKSAEKKKDTVDHLQVEPEVKVSNVCEGGDAVESAEKEKDTADSVLIEPDVKVSDAFEGGDTVESVEKKKDTADSVLIEPEVKVPDVLEGGQGVESAEKEKDTTDAVPKVLDVEEKENSPEEDELRTSETNDKGEDLKCSDVKVSSENCYNASDNSKPMERRVSLHATVDNQDDGRTHSGRKMPSYMAPTASAKARVKGEDSPRFSLEKTEKNGTMRRHSLPSPANGNTTTTTMSPRAHRLLLASAKGSMNGDKSFSSSKNTSDKSNRTEWKR